MNVDHEFKVIPNTIAKANRIRAYDISFHVPGFRTLEHDNARETNISRLLLRYTPRDVVIEFFSFHEYISKYQKLEMSLECACWSIIDDFFDGIKPLHCHVEINSELLDGIGINISADRGWRQAAGRGPSSLSLMNDSLEEAG